MDQEFDARLRAARTSPPPDGLLAFDSEGEAAGNPLGPDAPAPQAAHVSRDGARAMILWSLLAIAAAAATTSIVKSRPAGTSPPAPAPPITQPGHVTLDTSPAGAEVIVDGEGRGLTPLVLNLDPGHHEAMLRHGTDERTIALDVVPGGDVVHRIEFGAPTTAAALSIVTDPAGARVTVDGEPKGTSPILVSGLTAGHHRVVVRTPTASAERTVTTEVGTTSAVLIALATAPTTPALSAGWLTVTAPFEIRVVEGGDVIGTSAAPRIMMTGGTHQLDLVNQALGYQSARAVTIDAGKTATISLDARAPLDANATPWAEVTIDGTAAGVTPFANLSVSLGTHRVLFHHPTLGDRTVDVVVTQQGPNRVSADLTK